VSHTGEHQPYLVVQFFFVRFLKTVQNLKNLKSGQLDRLNIKVKKNELKRNLKKGIF
jgi:hypothetical protein